MTTRKGDSHESLPPSALTEPQMTTLAGRPLSVLYVPGDDLLVACRTAKGQDCFVPLSAFLARLGRDIVVKVARMQQQPNK